MERSFQTFLYARFDRVALELYHYCAHSKNLQDMGKLSFDFKNR